MAQIENSVAVEEIKCSQVTSSSFSGMVYSLKLLSCSFSSGTPCNFVFGAKFPGVWVKRLSANLPYDEK